MRGLPTESTAEGAHKPETSSLVIVAHTHASHTLSNCRSILPSLPVANRYHLTLSSRPRSNGAILNTDRPPGFGMAPAIKVSDERAQQVDALSRAHDTHTLHTPHPHPPHAHKCMYVYVYMHIYIYTHADGDLKFRGKHPRGRAACPRARETGAFRVAVVSVCVENSRPGRIPRVTAPRGAYSSDVRDTARAT